MIRIHATVATASAVAALALLTACTGDDTVTTSPDTSAMGQTPTTAAAAEQAAPATTPQTTAPQAATVGDTITVHGYNDGEELAVKVVKWVDPAHPADDYFTPASGKRWVAAQFELTNTGTQVYADSPTNGAQVADSQGQRFATTFGDVTAGPSMTSDAQVPPGEKALGYIVFEVPQASKVVSVQFTMDSGFADETAQWTIS